MRRSLRILGTLLTGAGILTLVWAFLVWQWQDPFTALYTSWKQHQLSSRLKRPQDDAGDDERDRPAQRRTTTTRGQTAAALTTHRRHPARR